MILNEKYGEQGGIKGKSKNENVENNICVTLYSPSTWHSLFECFVFLFCVCCVYTFQNQKAENFTSSFSSSFVVFISPSLLPFFGCLNFHHQGFLHAFGEFWLVLLWGNWKFLNMVRIMVVYYHFSTNKWLQLVTDT